MHTGFLNVNNGAHADHTPSLNTPSLNASSPNPSIAPRRYDRHTQPLGRAYGEGFLESDLRLRCVRLRQLKLGLDFFVR